MNGFRRRLMSLMVLVSFGFLFGIVSLKGADAATLGVLMARQKDPFVDSLTLAITEAAAKNGASTTVKVADNSADTQMQQAKALLASGVDALIVHAVDFSIPDPVAKMAEQANVPLIFINRKPPQLSFPGRVAMVVSNDLVAGRLQMRMLSKLMHDAGNLVVLVGKPPAGDGRTQGVHEVAKAYPGIKIVGEEKAEWSRAKAKEVVGAWIRKGLSFNAVAANNDEMALGAIEAITEAGLSPSEIIVAGVDATAAALEAMKQGALAFTIRQDAAEQGRRAVQDALLLMENQYVPLSDWVPYALVTPQVLAKTGK